MNKVLLICLAALVSFSSCEDDSDYELWTKSDYLVANGPWFLREGSVSYTANGVQNTEKISQYLPVCVADNYISFFPDGAVRIDENESKCNENDPQTYDTGVKWSLSDYETKLNAAIPGLSENVQFEILQLDAHNLRIRWVNRYQNSNASFMALFTHGE